MDWFDVVEPGTSMGGGADTTDDVTTGAADDVTTGVAPHTILVVGDGDFTFSEAIVNLFVNKAITSTARTNGTIYIITLHTHCATTYLFCVDLVLDLLPCFNAWARFIFASNNPIERK